MNSISGIICPNCGAITGLPLCKDCEGRGGEVGGSLEVYTWKPCLRCNGTGIEPQGVDYEKAVASGDVTRKP